MTPPRPDATEAEWQQWVIDRARECECLVYHTHDSRRSAPGFPDLVIVHLRHRVVLYRELKTAEGEVTKPQEHWLRCLRAIGEDAAVRRPADWQLVLKELGHEAAERPAPVRPVLSREEEQAYRDACAINPALGEAYLRAGRQAPAGEAT